MLTLWVKVWVEVEEEHQLYHWNNLEEWTMLLQLWLFAFSVTCLCVGIILHCFASRWHTMFKWFVTEEGTNKSEFSNGLI